MNSQFDITTPQHHPQMTTKSKGMPTWLIVLLILGMIGLSFVVLIAGLGFLFIYTAKQIEVTDADKQVILEAHELAEWSGGFEAAPDAGELLKQRYMDRTYDLEYTYEDENVFLYNLHTVERKGSDAIAGYAIGVTATKLSFKAEDVVLQERNDLYSWGDVSEFYLLEYDGEVYGMLFFGRKGSRYVEIIVSGYYSDEPDELQDLFDPPLRAFEDYDP